MELQGHNLLSGPAAGAAMQDLWKVQVQGFGAFVLLFGFRETFALRATLIL